jgi:osmoprotectant transport system substrate-binding protein
MMIQNDNSRRFLRGTRALVSGLVLAALGLTAFPGAGITVAAKPSAQAAINIGTKNFGEEYLISDMYALLLRKAGFRVNIKNLAQTPLLQSALRRGSIDLYPEYTGTGLGVVLKQTTPVHDAARAYKLVQAGYKKFGLTWLAQSYLNDTNGVGITAATSAKYGIHTISDLARASGNLSFAALPDCKDRADCLVGLQNRYGVHFKTITYLTAQPVMYKGLKSGQFDAVEVFTTDGAIKGLGVVVLRDDKGIFPADHIAPVVRNSILAKYPQIRPTLDRLARYITTKAQKRLNYEVDILGKDPLATARAVLRSKHLI